jgi:ribosomal protein L11 methylase PrmA
MYLGSGSCGSVWIAKLLGAYEDELSPFVEEAIAREPDVLVDLGCAEGYFAVGFARRLLQTTVIAADTNPFARLRAWRLARSNGVTGRVRLVGWMSAKRSELELAKARSPVLWCDIEGGEVELLDPLRVPSLRKACIMVEEHSHASGCGRSELQARFELSHECVLVEQVVRIQEEWIPPEMIASLKPEECELALSELRPPGQAWLVLRPTF